MTRFTWNHLAVTAAGCALLLWPLPKPARHDVMDAMRRGQLPLAMGTRDDPHAQAEMELMMLRDPRTNDVPRGIRIREAAFARSLPHRDAGLFRASPDLGFEPQALTWIERGPNNVGGRTRAFAVDVASPATLIAGSVAGGLWKSTDDGVSWTIRTAPSQIHGITCIAQDRRAGQTGVWYAGTGEIRGSTTNATRWGSLYLGDGIYKSTDGGETWNLLPSTSSGSPHVTDAFDYVVNVATNPANLAQAEVLAATHTGIRRSTNGGTSWTTVLPSDSGYTDVAITATGVMYAATRVGTGGVRVWRSPDGVTWTDIRPGTFTPTAGRIVIGLAPSNPLVAYFYIESASGTPAVLGHQLWKYTYVSGNGSGAGGTWVNRGGNLPSDINSQGGYDMVVHVKPNDENFVLLGGTNLYRSTDGFATTFNTTTIGGYPFFPGTHHPDLHSGAFSPVNPSVYYSSHDGGISKAPDITLPGMVWNTLNHGYNVTQFYSVSIPPDAGSPMIMAGAQDNGTQLGNAPGASDWVMVFGGDGTVVEVSPAADNRLYTQYQNGPMHRQNWDGTGVTAINPAGSTNALFVNPIVLDPNDSSILYYAAGVSSSSSRIWRNDSAPFATTTTGWTSLPATEVGAGAGYTRRITAMGISTAASPNVLYYGTSDGIVMKAVNANTATPAVSIITPPGLNGGTAIGGFVRCIAVDPLDSDRALLAFGNYNFQSLWYTTDGGASWTDVEGNLAGASGPSVRWATMFHLGGQIRVFLGTSIGVLWSGAVNGPSTIWSQEAGVAIGNVIIGYMDYRESDRTLAVGTHARGVFTTQFTPPTAVEEAGITRVMLGPGYPNPSSGSATIEFQLPRACEVSLRVYDVMGREVAVLVNGRRERGRHLARLEVGLTSGVYFCVLRADGAVESRILSLTK